MGPSFLDDVPMWPMKARGFVVGAAQGTGDIAAATDEELHWELPRHMQVPALAIADEEQENQCNMSDPAATSLTVGGALAHVGWSSEDDLDAGLPKRGPMEDEFSRAGIYAALIGHPSIRGYNLPAGLGTSGAYSIYPRPYLVRSDTELVGAFPENSNAHREATAICTTRACLGVIINGLMELEKSICRGTVKPDDLGDHVATWRTAVYQLLASKSASYDILLYLRRYKTFGHNLYRDLFLNRGAGRDSPAVPRYNVRVAADRAGTA
ncbi:hypothetical protein I4F81_004191 [Pyropia yezoensis]|uniref:Uncharacterized protein n=1 Tax=Pyropia yezoensis TaxID=2788 RepID=A0ACC3BUM0_PYRYE|nr:hypothetical protein I4F81_004191 [Neopyropia yezoensis]